MFEQKNPFPKWARRLNPLLEGAEREHLFMLFRERRREWPIVLIAGITICIVVLLDLLGVLHVGGFIWLVLLVVLLLPWRVGVGKTRASSSSVAFQPVRYRRELLDLWTSGCSGSQLMRQVCLERVEGAVNRARQFCLILLPLTAFYFLHLGFGQVESWAWFACTAWLTLNFIGKIRSDYVSQKTLIGKLSAVWRAPNKKTHRFLRFDEEASSIMTLTAVLVLFSYPSTELFNYIVIIAFLSGFTLLVPYFFARPLKPEDLKPLMDELDVEMDVLVQERLVVDGSLRESGIERV